MMTRLRPRILDRRLVFSWPDEAFSAVVETERWGFGFKVHDYRDRGAARPAWVLRVMFWRWHFCWDIGKKG
jgi:hypothetical protein